MIKTGRNIALLHSPTLDPASSSPSLLPSPPVVRERLPESYTTTTSFMQHSKYMLGFLKQHRRPTSRQHRGNRAAQEDGLKKGNKGLPLQSSAKGSIRPS